MELAAVLASREARKALAAMLAAAGRRALRAKRRNGWRWEGAATRRRMALADAAAAGFPGAGALWLVEVDAGNPLRLVSEEGVAFVGWWARYPSDGGSVPGWVAGKWGEGMDLSRWGKACAYAMHDASYSAGKVWIVGGGVARAAELDRRTADDLLAAGLCAEGPDGGAGWVEAETVAAGVRTGGGAAWKRWRENPPDMGRGWWRAWEPCGTR